MRSLYIYICRIVEKLYVLRENNLAYPEEPDSPHITREVLRMGIGY